MEIICFGTTQNTSATTGSSMDSYLLGSHTWKIEEDYKKCSIRGEAYVRRLKLSGCQDDEFTCSDGQCISMVERCDQIIQCRDESDEMECSILLIKDSYNKKVPPFTIDKKNKLILPVKVYISTNLKNVIEISEVNHLIELEALWIPYIIFDNTDNEDAVTIYDTRSSVSVKREGSFTRSGPEIADEIEIFQGKENRITMNQTHSKKFHCTYLLHYFPFDTQVRIRRSRYELNQICVGLQYEAEAGPV